MFQAAKLAKMKIPPSEMFLSESDKYSKFDENVSSFCSFQNLGRSAASGRQELSTLGGLFCMGCGLQGAGTVHLISQRPGARQELCLGCV